MAQRGWLYLYVVVLVGVCDSLMLHDFYKFGAQTGDAELRPDSNHILIALTSPVYLCHHQHGSLYVNRDGVISFDEPIVKSSNSDDIFDHRAVVAPFYVGGLTKNTITVFYRETTEKVLLDRATSDIQIHFPTKTSFKASNLFLATWLVDNPSKTKTNLFQVVFVNNEDETFVLFHYEHLKIKSNTTFPLAGFTCGNENSERRLPGSGTDDVYQLGSLSNDYHDGIWVYKIGSRAPRGIGLGGMMSGQASNTGCSGTCGDNSNCDTSTSCCVCRSGYHGNGRYCLKNEQSSHMFGTLSGKINNIEIKSGILSVFADYQSSTTYFSVVSISQPVGWLLRALFPMVTTPAFYFAATSGANKINGYEIFGEMFIRRARVTFETGEVCLIREEILNRDGSGRFLFTIHLSGSVPRLPENATIDFERYQHSYRYDVTGMMTGYYRFKMKVDNVPQVVKVVEMYEFDEVSRCSNVGRFKVAISRQKAQFVEKDNIIRFKLSAVVGEHEIRHCGKSTRKCHSNAYCLKVQDDAGLCLCKDGFEGDGYNCKDVDECASNSHDCSANAKCLNNFGSFSCACNHGYIGDGKKCEHETDLCGIEKKKCNENSECVAKDGVERCECFDGFSALDDLCKDVDECFWDIHNCSLKADCVNIIGSYKCVCRSGFQGDGRTCEISTGGGGSGAGCTSDGEQCGEHEICEDGKCICASGFLAGISSCEDVNECEVETMKCNKNASCVNTVGSFECTCNEGYVGNGFRCDIIDKDECELRTHACDRNAACRNTVGSYTCSCNQGYIGDGRTCEDINECAEDICQENEQCVNQPGSYSCECRTGFEREEGLCTSNVSVNPCDHVRCGSRAKCVVENDSALCQCKPGYHGRDPFCLDFDECENERDKCHHKATCVNMVGSYKCYCAPGYFGNGFNCQSDGSCAGINCHKNAACLDVNNTMVCQCNHGFTGSGLLCADIDECTEGDVKCPTYSQCVNTYGSYECTCMVGYNWDGDKCTPVCPLCRNGGICNGTKCICPPGYSGDWCQWSGNQFMVFSQGSTIKRTSVPPRQQDVGILYSISGNKSGLIVALDYDYKNQYIYFTDAAGKALWRVRFNGTGAEKIITEGISSPEGIAVDYLAGNIYWTDSQLDRVEVAKVDGSERKLLFKTRLINPRSIVVHPRRGTMYWADWNRAAPKIEVAHMDGASRRVFIDENIGLPNGLTIDMENDKICWTDARENQISCANFDGSDLQVVVPNARYPFGVTFFGKYLYWTEWSSRTINQYDTVTSQLIPALVSSSNGLYYGIKSVQPSQHFDDHACTKNNGGCSNLCLTKPEGITCACPTGYHLVDRDDYVGSGEVGGSGQSGSGHDVVENQAGEISGFGSGSGVTSVSSGVSSTSSGMGPTSLSSGQSSREMSSGRAPEKSTEKICVINSEFIRRFL